MEHTQQTDIYCDTNVYGMIAQHNEAQAVRELLDRREYAVLASGEHLVEMYAIVDPDRRRQELASLTTVASRFERYPATYLHAQELLSEIRQRRQNWLKRRKPNTTNIEMFLEAHRRRWAISQRDPNPPRTFHGAYQADAEAGTAGVRTLQKELRRIQREGGILQVMASGCPDIMGWASGLERDEEIYWRVMSMIVWHNAVVGRVPASRDYADWTLPYLREDAFMGAAYCRFWQREARASSMPYSRLTGLVEYYQLRHKISHGNPIDALHANHMLDSSIFITADRAFFGVLNAVAEKVVGVARPLLIDRAARSAVDELDRVLSAFKLVHTNESGLES